MTPNYTAIEISKDIGSRRILDGVSLGIEEREFFLLLGPSGSGKTTLLRILAGLEKPNHGQLLFGDRNVTELAPEDRNIGFVFQNYALWPHLTVAQNITFGLEMRRFTKSDRDARLKEVLALVQLDEFGNRYPHQLSGGQQQRVALARALAPRPQLLLLDEPLSNLDASLRRAIRAELKALHRSCGLTTICVTHDREDAFALADRIGVLVDGRLDQVGTPHELYERPTSPAVARVTGDTITLRGTIEAVALDTSTPERRWLVSCRVSNSLLHAISYAEEAPQGCAIILSRPESWHVVAASEVESTAQGESQKDLHYLKATTVSVSYEGDRHRIDSIIGDGHSLHLYYRDIWAKEAHSYKSSSTFSSGITAGSEITIGYSPDSLLLFAGNGLENSSYNSTSAPTSAS